MAVGAVQVFFEVFGQVAGDIALSMGTSDGIYIAGGIVRRYPQMLQDGPFRSAFESKGEYRPLMQKIPTQLVTCEEPGLLGASHVAREMIQAGNL